MSLKRPRITALLLATLIESTPDRVRRRFDRTPDAAAGWEWESGEEGWTIVAGEESIQLPLDHITSIDQISCTCLLSPQCFHVIACLTRLEVMSVVTASMPEDEAELEQSGAIDQDLIE